MKATSIFAAALLLLSAQATRGQPLLTHTDVFVSGRDGYALYRIPAIETAPEGALLAFAEARKYGGGDPGFGRQEIDLVLKRSSDGGRTWSAMNVVEHAGPLWSAGNPATLVDHQNGRVWVLYLRSKPGRSTLTARPGTDDMQTLARWSADRGRTWSDPVDLSKIARDYNDPAWRASVIGPGGAIQTRTGRLAAPVWKFSPYGVCTIFSDDHGQTWRRGAVVPGGRGGDEDQLVELADGRLRLDIRQENGPRRLVAVSSDGGRTWSEPRPGEAVSPVACAIHRLSLKSAGDDRDRILWTGPQGPGRKTLVVRVSYDEGQTFSRQRVLSAEPAAYSSLTILNDKTVGVLWERAGYKYLTFTRFNREFLEEEATPGATK